MEKLIEYKRIENTPFTMAKKENGVVILMGNNLMTNKIFENYDKAQKWVNTKPWELITAMTGVIATAVYQDILHLGQTNIGNKTIKK